MVSILFYPGAAPELRPPPRLPGLHTLLPGLLAPRPQTLAHSLVPELGRHELHVCKDGDSLRLCLPSASAAGPEVPGTLWGCWDGSGPELGAEGRAEGVRRRRASKVPWRAGVQEDGEGSRAPVWKEGNGTNRLGTREEVALWVKVGLRAGFLTRVCRL